MKKFVKKLVLMKNFHQLRKNYFGENRKKKLICVGVNFFRKFVPIWHLYGRKPGGLVVTWAKIQNMIFSKLLLGLFCLLLTAFIIICCCRLNHRKKKIENGKRRSRSKKEREKVTSDELVTSNIYETGLEATNPIFGLPPKDDKGAAGNRKNFIWLPRCRNRFLIQQIPKYHFGFPEIHS